MDNKPPRKIAGILWSPDLKRDIIILIVFFLIYLALGSATGINSSSPGESADILNESLSQDETFSFGTLNILDDNDNPHFCMVTLYDNEGVLKVSDFTDTLSIEIINPGSHLNIESNDNNILLDFSINGDSFDPVVRIADYGISNPTSNYELHGSPLKYISVDASNLSYSNLRIAISYSGMDENIDTSKLKIFKYVETFAYNEWIKLPTHIDELNQVVWTDTDSTSIFVVSMAGSTAQLQNITIGDVSLLNSIGIPQPGEITIIGPEGNIIAGPVGTLALDETPSGSHLNINSSETNIRLDFTLHADSSNPVILLEDFGTNNPAGDYSPPGEPVKYLMIGAENLGYSGVNLTLKYPDISGNSSIFRFSETFAYNEWEELPAVVDTTNNTITTSLDSLSIFALSKITPVGVKVLDNRNAPLMVEIKTYDYNENPRIVKRGHTLSVDELPRPGYIAIDALVEKDIAVVFKSSYSSGGEIVLENYARHNPEAIDPNRIPVKFVEIHARNLTFDSADIEIHYSDDEIGSLDENKLQISHFSGGAWVTLDSTVDTVNNMVRASTDSLSTFALVYNGTSVNTNKSIYRPGEMAGIMIVVLDSAGAPVSDASIRMNLTAPKGSVGYFSTVTGSIVETSDPGVYEAAYLTGGEGRYNISCTAIIEGSESGFDTYFMVQSEYDFDIIRHAQSKIDPTKYDTFDVGVDIISYTDADSIIIWEYVPADFEVYTDASVVEADNLKVLTWQRSLVNNRTSVNYSYSVPMEWPKLYQLGPVEVDYGNETFTEARPWWVAVDPVFNNTPDSAVEDDTTNVITEVSTSDNSYATLDVDSSGSGDNTDWIESNWSDNGIPDGSTIISVTYYFEHKESQTDRVDLTIDWWDGDAWTQVCNPGQTTIETNSSCDLSSYIDIVTEANDVKLRYKWISTSGSETKYTYLDYEYIEIVYTPPAGGANTTPSISNVVSSGVTRSQAHITWDTNQSDSNNRVKYSIYSNLSAHNWSNWDNNTDSVHIQLTSLSPSTKYYYSAYSYNGTNNSLHSNSSIHNFTTTGNATAQGNVEDKDGSSLTCEITVYDDDGTTVLNSTTGNSFDLYDVPIGGYILFDANSSKDVLAKFKINDNSSNVVIILDDYGLNNQESTAAPGNPIKYVNVSATNLSYESVEIKISYTDAELGSMNENQLVIYHYKNSAWSELSTSVDAAYNILTASTTSLSTFAATAANLSYTVVARTDKAVYLMDPYNWVYASGHANWTGGHPRNVTINAMIIDPYGRLVPNERYPSEPTVRYRVVNATGIEVANSTMTNTSRIGFYNATFEINETNLGGNNANYSTESLPKTYTIYVNATISDKEANSSDTFKADRWSCDRYGTDATSCHYPISWGGQHSGSWNEMLGEKNTGSAYFDITLLQNASKTHTPPDIHDNNGKHETTIKAIGGCSQDCHRSSTSPVLCTDCHDTPIYGAHTNVADPDATWPNCANTSCHGRLNNTTAVNRVDNSFPNCSDCHPISYRDNFTATSQNLSISVVPQWLNTTTGTPRDIAVHPNPDNAIVNCTFCHNSFHNLYSQSSVLACFDCHQVAENYSTHNGTLSPLTGVNCTSCHNNTVDKIDIHNTITPACSECHNEANHSSYNTTGVNCLQCHNDNLLNYSGSVLVNNTYWTNTSIHSQDEILPNCTICHTGYYNHSSYDTYGVKCSYCHNNATLNYSGNILPANTTYNAGTAIHTPNATEMKPGCTPCHNNKNNHTSYNTTGVICIQCHNNATLNYTGTKMYSAEYNTGTTVHTANTTPASSSTLSPLCTTCHTKTGDEIDTGYDDYAMNDDSNNLAPSGSNMTHKRDTITGNWYANDPPDYNVRYARHANPNSSGGWSGANGTARDPNQICINCHSELIREWGINNEGVWFDCKPCHQTWIETIKPDAHKLSIPYCSDCHVLHTGTSNPYWHTGQNILVLPKDYTITPDIGFMINDSAHKRMILNTSTSYPTNPTGCLVCHTTVTFTVNSTPDALNINITNHSGAHTWDSKPACTKCHSIDSAVQRPGPYPYEHDILGMEWGNNTQCLECHNIYNQTLGRYHGHNATTESCTACHYNYTAMNDYGKPSVYVNETMYESSVHGTSPGTNCSQCHTNYHPPPEYTWKWCECCHSYQSDPINETDRHNVTADPLSYSINVSGTLTPVLNITDCTICHNATQYNTSKETFNRASGKDCRYCHTFPDQTYN